jgi:hypothetical protein
VKQEEIELENRKKMQQELERRTSKVVGKKNSDPKPLVVHVEPEQEHQSIDDMIHDERYNSVSGVEM